MKNVFVKIMMVTLFSAISLLADLQEHQTIQTAIHFLKNADFKVPQKVLDNAQAVVIIPDFMQGGALVGAGYGSGILTVKNDNGWSDPCFVNFRNLNVGFQVGGDSTDIIMIFENRRGINGIEEGKGTLSIDSDIAVFNKGNSISRKTDEKLSADIYVYGKSSGLNVNIISISSGNLYIDDVLNDKYYGDIVNTTSLLLGYKKSNYPEVKDLKRVLTDFLSNGY